LRCLQVLRCCLPTTKACPIKAAFNRNTNHATFNRILCAAYGDLSAAAQQISVITPASFRSKPYDCSPPRRAQIDQPQSLTPSGSSETEAALRAFEVAMRGRMDADSSWCGALEAMDVFVCDQYGNEQTDGNFFACGLRVGRYPISWDDTLEKANTLIAKLCRFASHGESFEPGYWADAAASPPGGTPYSYFVIRPTMLRIPFEGFTNQYLRQTFMSFGALGASPPAAHKLLEQGVSCRLISKLLACVDKSQGRLGLSSDVVAGLKRTYSDALQRGAIVEDHFQKVSHPQTLVMR
jgi:hypothetical protein